MQKLIKDIAAHHSVESSQLDSPTTCTETAGTEATINTSNSSNDQTTNIQDIHPPNNDPRSNSSTPSIESKAPSTPPKPSEKGTSTPLLVQADSLQKSPEEVAFFKFMHVELKKVSQFFDQAEQEASIRNIRILEGTQYVKQHEVSLVTDKWNTSARAIYHHYKDLLVLETYAIMSFCAFSKALKKHDKITGHNTRKPFMTRLVNKANFTTYPTLMDMITHCQSLQEKVSLEVENSNLAQDERLFLDMIEILNGEAMATAELEGASNLRLCTTGIRRQMDTSEDTTTRPTKLPKYA